MKLKRGVNLGGFLSQCVHTTEHYNTFIGESDIDFIASKGFDHVRLPIDYNVLETDDGQVIEAGYGYVTNVINWAKKNNIDVILDLHKAYGYDFNFASSDTEENSLFKNPELQVRFTKLWLEIAKRYADRDNVAFELLNEIVEVDVIEDWNVLSNNTIASIREIAPDTPIIYGGVQWNSATTLKYLEKPKFDNVIFTFHFYEPLIFTHQKAPWVKGMDQDLTVSYPESMDYYRELSTRIGDQGKVAINAAASTMGEEFFVELISEAIEVAKKNGVQLYCGEFGVIDRAPVDDTLRWYMDINDVFRKYDIGFAVWSYKKMDFGIIDEHYAPIADQLINCWNN